MILLGSVAAVGSLAAAAWAIVVYNGLVAARRQCDRAFANIDVLLKQRHDEVPRLVEICRGYMAYEQATLARVAHARSLYAAASSPADKAEASTEVSGALRQLFSVAERYPDLEADRSFLRLQERVSQLESQIADRREAFNAAVTEWNTRIQQVPEAFLARAAGMSARPLWRAAAADRPPVSLSLTS
jgi:LemA protein